ncbi:MAG: pyridoxamine 5'-phosphate oxidase family protein [Nibricoccus sp.]
MPGELFSSPSVMGKFFEQLTPAHREFIARQKIYFVATAPDSGRVNVSPKGYDSFRVLSPSRAGYLDLTGSGSETSAHLTQNGRATLMFCAFEGDPLILRLYGRGQSIQPHHDEWKQLRPLFGPPLAGERQLVIIDIESVQTSCGFGVPFFESAGPRTTLVDWAERKGPEGLAAYRVEKTPSASTACPPRSPPDDPRTRFRFRRSHHRHRDAHRRSLGGSS